MDEIKVKPEIEEKKEEPKQEKKGRAKTWRQKRRK